MKRGRIKVTLYNRTLKEIDMSDFSYISEDIFSNRSDVVKIELPEGVEMVMPGDNITMTVQLISPIAMNEGLRFAVREGGRTVGAGVVAKIIE